MTIPTRAKGVVSESLFWEFFFLLEEREEGHRGAWRVGTYESHGLASWKEAKTLMEPGSGYSCKFPPSQNTACTLLVGAFPIEGCWELLQDHQKQ